MPNDDKNLSAEQKITKIAPKIVGSIKKMFTNQIFGGGGETATQYPEGTDKINPALLTRFYEEIQARMNKTNDFDSKTLTRRAKERVTKSKGGTTTKNRIGGNDYRKGGYVLSTVDNKKKKQ
jgi:hypothetical protein